jgi:microcystin degradation protein MlrC
MRIALAGMMHESCTFSSLFAELDDFRLVRGPQALDYLEIGDALPDRDVECVPLLYADGPTPGGWIRESAYLQIRREILDGLASAGELDGVCLVMHGSSSVENIFSGEADLVRAVRAGLGNGPLIAVRLDAHANLNEEFANKADIWTPFRTAPHRDQRQALERALALLARALRSGRRPRPVFVRVPALIPGEMATTESEPMRSLQAAARGIEQQPGLLSADVVIGFANTDVPYGGLSVVVIAEDDASLPLARVEARRLAQQIWDQRFAFGFDRETAPSLDAAVRTALEAPERPVFIADVGDNPTAGVPGDNPHALARLLALGVPDAVLAGIPDADAFRVCARAGVGELVTLELGGKLDVEHGAPLPVAGVVEHLYRPEAAGMAPAIATLRVNGVRVLITDRRKAFTLLADFRMAGIDPLAHKLIVVKLGYLFPELRDAAPREILAMTPGFNDMDLTRLPWRYQTRPIFPLDRDMQWRPIVTNVAGYSD